MGVNMVIKRGRVGIRDDRDFPAGEVRDAGTEALLLRSGLVEMRRFDESARMLMLAADAWAVLRDPGRARAAARRCARLAEFYGVYRQDGHGRAAHEPSMMLTLLM
jgi:hypothetical protein